jgi:hypothetical protein
MTYTAGFDTDAYLSCTRRNNRPLYEVKSAGLRYFDCPIRFSHLRLLSIFTNCLVFLHRNFGSSAFLTTLVCCFKGRKRAIPQMPETIGHLIPTNYEISGIAVDGGQEKERTAAN